MEKYKKKFIKEGNFRSWSVTGQSFNRISGRPTAKQRVETVDSDNELFSRCKTAQDVHEAYERFWNDLNGRSSEVVFVLRVEEN